MLQRPSCVHFSFWNLTIAILYCLVLHSISSSYFRKFKIQLFGLLLKPQELNILHPSFVPFTGCPYKRESGTSSALFVMLHWLAQVWSTCQNLSMYTLHPDACAHHQIAVLSQSCVRTKTCGQRSFAYQGSSTWSDLPFDLRHKDSLYTFKSALKTQLFHHFRFKL